MDARAVIVGAGHSGGKAAQALRKRGWTGPITLVGDESQPPYDRPPLSKAVLLGKKSVGSCLFRPDEWYREQSIDLILERKVTAIDRQRKCIVLDDEQCISYDCLLIATGAEPNPLPIPGANLPGVSAFRTADDATRVSSYLNPGTQVVIVGAGFIGLEVAAAAVEKGCVVTVLEMASAPLGRVLPKIVASALTEIHSQRGVMFRFGVSVAEIEGIERVEAVRLATGERVSCDHVVYGVGARPRTFLAEEAGLHVSNGIRVDSSLRTTDPDIYACGDVCSYYSARYKQDLRLESWKNAEDQADLAARSMLGHETSYDELPWFWSNQYEVALQVAGLPTLGSITISRPAGRGVLFFSLDESGVLMGVCGLGPIPDIAVPVRLLKAWIDSGVHLCVDRLTDVTIPLTDARNFELAAAS
ncbi:FAD-dependent oxidoreductase [Paraburkholderia bengalensis]|uniref:FAD-dependent oxidoreductase n=1 Tax=Paraburkholderia bengalensis TaxID=2747562 RepID=A0ABU8ILL4_9BURK